MKARTKAQKRRSKRAMERQWQAQEDRPEPKEDARIVVLSARCRQLGREDTEANRLALAHPMAGDPVGQAIMLRFPHADDRTRLWDVFRRLATAYVIMCRRKLGLSPFAKVAKIEMMPERFETSADDDLDTRTPEEKDRDAIDRWAHWQSIMAKLGIHQRMDLMDALVINGPYLRDGELTQLGRDVADAVFALADVEQMC